MMIIPACFGMARLVIIVWSTKKEYFLLNVKYNAGSYPLSLLLLILLLEVLVLLLVLEGSLDLSKAIAISNLISSLLLVVLVSVLALALVIIWSS